MTAAQYVEVELFSGEILPTVKAIGTLFHEQRTANAFSHPQTVDNDVNSIDSGS